MILINFILLSQERNSRYLVLACVANGADEGISVVNSNN